MLSRAFGLLTLTTPRLTSAELAAYLDARSVEEGVWRAWTTRQVATPAPPGIECHAGQLKLPGQADVELCLEPPGDWVSDVVRKKGRYFPQADQAVNTVLEEPSTPLFVDLGANIGTVTLEVLLRTAPG